MLYIVLIYIIGTIIQALHNDDISWLHHMGGYGRIPHQPCDRRASNLLPSFSSPQVTGVVHKPGQFVFLHVPEISLLSWHPFTIASSPQDRSTSFILKVHFKYSNIVKHSISHYSNRHSAPFTIASSPQERSTSLILQGRYILIDTAL